MQCYTKWERKTRGREVGREEGRENGALHQTIMTVFDAESLWLIQFHTPSVLIKKEREQGWERKNGRMGRKNGRMEGRMEERNERKKILIVSIMIDYPAYKHD